MEEGGGVEGLHGDGGEGRGVGVCDEIKVVKLNAMVTDVCVCVCVVVGNSWGLLAFLWTNCLISSPFFLLSCFISTLLFKF